MRKKIIPFLFMTSVSFLYSQKITKENFPEIYMETDKEYKANDIYYSYLNDLKFDKERILKQIGLGIINYDDKIQRKDLFNSLENSRNFDNTYLDKLASASQGDLEKIRKEIDYKLSIEIIQTERKLLNDYYKSELKNEQENIIKLLDENQISITEYSKLSDKEKLILVEKLKNKGI